MKVQLIVMTVGLMLCGQNYAESCRVFPDSQVIQQHLNQLRERHELVGISLAYSVNATNNTESFASGLADIAAAQPMSTDTRLLMASIGKTFVGALMLDLEHKGYLSIDEPIAKYLKSEPWFHRLPENDKISIRDLLRHHSGINDYVYSTAFAEAFNSQMAVGTPPNFTTSELIGFALDNSTSASRWGEFGYSDVNYLLLGILIEKVTHKTYYELVDRAFITPQRLHGTSPSNVLKLTGLAVGYVGQNIPLNIPTQSTNKRGELRWNPAFEWTGGGFVTTSSDIAKWGARLFSGRAMSHSYLPRLLAITDNAAESHYGLGVAVSYDGELGAQYGHAGWVPGYVSSLRYYPDKDVSIAFQTNTDIPFAKDPELLKKLENDLAKKILSHCHSF